MSSSAPPPDAGDASPAPTLTKSSPGLAGAGPAWTRGLGQSQGFALRDELDRVRRLMSGLGIVMTGSAETSPEAGVITGLHRESPIEVSVNASSNLCLVTILVGVGFHVPVTHEMLQWLAVREPPAGYVWVVEPTSTGSVKTCSVIMRATIFAPYADERFFQMLTSATDFLDTAARFRARFGGRQAFAEQEG